MTRIAVIIGLLSAASFPAAHGQPAPEQALLVQGQQALDAKDVAKAIECFKALTERFPGTPSAADATVLWFGLAVSQADTAQQAALEKAAFTRWPRSETVWKVIELSCNSEAKTDAAKAVTDLERLMKDPAFPPDAQLRADRLRLTYLEQSNPAAFLTEGLGMALQVDGVETPEDLDAYVSLSGRLYPPLLKANRLDDAKSLRKKVQAKIALMGNPNDWMTWDSLAYFDALAAANPAQFLTDAKPVILAVQWADKPEDANLPAQLAKRAYALYFAQGRLDDVQAIHTTLQQALRTAKLDALASDDNRAYAAGRLKSLYEKDPKQWLVEALPFAATATDVKTPWDMGTQAEAARLAFSPLVAAGRLGEAKALCDRICAEERRVNGDPEGIQEFYFNALGTQPAEVFLAEAIPALDAAKTAKAAPDIALAVHVLKWGYPDLMATGKLAEAQGYHVAIQASIKRLGSPAGMAAAEQQLYLGALVKVKPEMVLAEVKPLLSVTSAPASPDEALERAMLAQGAYGPLMTAGRLEDANALHQRVQGWLTAANKPDEVKADADAFRQSVSKEAVEAMYTLFKQSLAANDVDGARRWLTDLNMVAPEHPRAVQARAMFKQFEDQQPK